MPHVCAERRRPTCHVCLAVQGPCAAIFPTLAQNWYDLLDQMDSTEIEAKFKSVQLPRCDSKVLWNPSPPPAVPPMAPPSSPPALPPFPPSPPAQPPSHPPICYPCVWPNGTLEHTAIVLEDATLHMHSFYTKLAVGGRLIDGTPWQSATVGGDSFVGAIDPSANIRWKGGVVIGGEFPFEWWHFEHLAQRLKVGTYGPPHDRYRVYAIDQGTEGGSYDLRHFNPHESAQGEDQGRTLVVFRGSGPIHLHCTWDGRQFGPTVLAPYADVVLDGDVGFVDGLIVARTLSGKNGAAQIQLHGDAYKGPIVCEPCTPWEPYIAPTATPTSTPAPTAAPSTAAPTSTPTLAPTSAPTVPTVPDVMPDVSPSTATATSADLKSAAAAGRAAGAAAAARAVLAAATGAKPGSGSDSTGSATTRRGMILGVGAVVLVLAAYVGHRRQSRWMYFEDDGAEGQEGVEVREPLTPPSVPSAGRRGAPKLTHERTAVHPAFSTL